MRNQFLRLTITLALVAGLAAGALALVDSFTAPRIAEAKEAAEQTALREALPGASDFQEDPTFLAQAQAEDASFGIVLAFYRASDAAGNPVGVVITVDPTGYGGPIEAMVGVDTGGRVEAVRVLEQKETPGLGSNVTSDEFLQEYHGAAVGETLAVNKDGGRIAALTGATISSRAMTSGVNVALTLAERAGL